MTGEHLHLMQVLLPLLRDTPWWEKRDDVAWYVSRCEMAGFCSTDDMRRLCAQRYMAGKRRVSPPGSTRRKNAERARQKLLRDMPQEFEAAITHALASAAAQEYLSGNAKAVNALVGMVLRRIKVDPAAARHVLVTRLDGEKSRLEVATTQRDKEKRHE